MSKQIGSCIRCDAPFYGDDRVCRVCGCNTWTHPNDLDKESIRRETATQLLAGMIMNPLWRNSEHEDGELVMKSIELTDLLLKKLGE